VEYSLPPLRFKERGILGILVGAATQRPALFLVFVAMTGTWNWLAAVLTAWLLLGGFLAILGHQVEDFQNDVRARVDTFTTRRGCPLVLRCCFACAAGTGVAVLAPFAFVRPADALLPALAMALMSLVYASKGVRALGRLRKSARQLR